MILLTDHQGKKYKVPIVPTNKIQKYKKRPGVYITIQDMSYKTEREETLIPWKQQKR